jgi:Lrp/AsnC family transcriptional regulator, leucine-responsive regulatory protein
MAPHDCDRTDEAILALLTENARLSLTEIGRRVNLSPAAVNRRMKRLEQDGIIRGYTVLVDDTSQRRGMHAFVELHVAGTARVDDIGQVGRDIDEVRAVFTVAGDPDALVWVNVSDVEHLQRTIDRLRRNDRITGTKTLMVLDSWHRSESSSRAGGRRRGGWLQAFAADATRKACGGRDRAKS